MQNESTTAIKLSQTRIMCVGMCVLDIIHVCEHFPAEDSDKRCLAGYWQRGGNASNMATVLRQLGAQCEYLGMMSESPAFGFLLQDCQKRGITIENCPSCRQDPPFSSVILAQQSKTRTIIHSNENFPILTYENFAAITNLSIYSWIHFEARNPKETLKMLRHIRDYNERHSLNIKISVEFEKVLAENLVLASWADYVFLGKDLANHLGWKDPHTAVFGLRNYLQTKLGERRDCSQPAIICPWGAHGASCLSDANDYDELAPAQPNEIVDSLGAGDTFCAATIYGLLELQLSLKQAVSFGNRCAGYKLGYCGYDAIEKFMLLESQI